MRQMPCRRTRLDGAAARVIDLARLAAGYGVEPLAGDLNGRRVSRCAARLPCPTPLLTENYGRARLIIPYERHRRDLRRTGGVRSHSARRCVWTKRWRRSRRGRRNTRGITIYPYGKLDVSLTLPLPSRRLSVWRRCLYGNPSCRRVFLGKRPSAPQVSPRSLCLVTLRPRLSAAAAIFPRARA